MEGKAKEIVIGVIFTKDALFVLEFRLLSTYPNWSSNYRAKGFVCFRLRLSFIFSGYVNVDA